MYHSLNHWKELKKTLEFLRNSFHPLFIYNQKLIKYSIILNSPLSFYPSTLHVPALMTHCTTHRGHCLTTRRSVPDPGSCSTNAEACTVDKEPHRLALTMFNGIYTPVGYLNSFIQSNKGSLKQRGQIM